MDEVEAMVNFLASLYYYLIVHHLQLKALKDPAQNRVRRGEAHQNDIFMQRRF